MHQMYSYRKPKLVTQRDHVLLVVTRVFKQKKDRTIKVKTGRVYSGVKHTTVGVPQGGVLSATLFNIVINRILEDIPSGVKGSLYADDLVIYHRSKRTQTLARTL